MITFIQKKGKNLIFAKYNKQLEKVIDNFKGVGTVRKFKDTLFIKLISFPYSTELMSRNGVDFKVITEL